MACSDLDYWHQANAAGVAETTRQALFDMRRRRIARVTGAVDLEEPSGLALKDSQLHRSALEAMTVSETSFFREWPSFEMLRETIVPQLIALRSRDRRLRVWSAAVSTGQEAYSVGMLLREYFPELERWDVKIVGTDVSRQAVEVAQKGRYRRADINRGLPVKMLVKYLEKEKEWWAISGTVREMCEFREADLREPMSTPEQFDLVLFRNSLLYFSLLERERLFGQIREKMAADGCLLLGDGEQAEDSTELFKMQIASNGYVYRPVNEI